jgi:aryl-alcohol dehydrogenase-like predicted oxidoreductase
VSRVGFGAARFAESVRGASDRDLISLLRASYDQGVTFFDTAFMYSEGRSEELLGRAFGPSNDRVVISSKVGYRPPFGRVMKSKVKPLMAPLLRSKSVSSLRTHHAQPVLHGDYRPANITRCLDTSLRRLKRQHLDLYLLHGMPPPHERPAALDCLFALRRSGRVRFVGLSCEEWVEAIDGLSYPGIDVMQVTVNLLEHSNARSFLAKAEEMSIGIVARQCFAGGWLAKQGPSTHPDRAVAAQIDAFEGVAGSGGRQLAEMAFRFPFEEPGVSTVLIGARDILHVEAARRFAAASPLSQDEKAEIARISSPHVDPGCGPQGAWSKPEWSALDSRNLQ